MKRWTGWTIWTIWTACVWLVCFWATAQAQVGEVEPVEEQIQSSAPVTITSTAIDSRVPCGEKMERVKMIVTLSDGTKRDYWPRVVVGIKDAVLLDQARASVQAELDAAAVEAAKPSETVPRAEVDAVIAKLQEAGKVTAKTYEELKTEVAVAVEVPK